MSGTPLVLALCGAGLVSIGLYGFLAGLHLLRRVLAFNVMGGGLFLLFGATAARSGPVDPVPQALIITGIVVALSLTALAVALVAALAGESGRGTLPEETPDSAP
ncbi:NADH-quinone oxidoreductase subunit K [Aureimonas sp. SK2]|uniref:NADH-quinone oxidoreductase subunit K n=1 Tax=Aureimonas sp. SK2 TaxID=3015992 RepID=UPI0024447B20|nr:NADH-quinone oxidoreductase subunit K [Aureimonas sp. SK2]